MASKNVYKKLDILENQDYAPDARDILKSWREALNTIEVDKAYAKLKNTRDIINASNSRVAAIDKKLLEERKMTIEDREYVLGVKDALRTLVYWLDAGDYDNRAKSIEVEIDKNLEKGENE
jgi:GH24 family phage-related lysozyme (muramidase)